MRRSLRAGAPDLAPALLVVALLVWLVVEDGGYAITRWAPVGIVAVALLAVRLAVAPPAWRAVPRPVLVATGALALYTAWSGLSIAWAHDRGIAWEGTDRTLLYLALFALLALWPLRPAAAGAVAGAWVLATGVFALVTFVHLASVSDPSRLFISDRVLGPAGYVNASAALWLMALWPAALLAAARETPWAARGVLVGAAAVLADLALLSQSRGSVLAMPLTGVLLLLALPGRVRLFGVLLAVGAAVGVATPALQHVGAVVRDGRSPAGALDTALVLSLAGAAVAGALVAAGGMVARRRPVAPGVARGAHRAGALAMGACAVVAVVGALAVAGSPAAAASRAWHSFKQGYTDQGQVNRLSTGLGSNRYDFYRVGLDALRSHPVGGLGADNFRAAYLQQGSSPETPAYPHSVEIRALASTGLVGAALLLAFAIALGVAVVGAGRATGSALGVAAIGAFAYWAVHGSADWFWEVAGLGGAAFAAAGLAAATAPRSAAATATRTGSPLRVAWAVAGIALIAALVPPWLAGRELDRAGPTFAADPGRAISHLRRAASLDPLSTAPLNVEGAAWLRVGDPARAQAAFAAARERDAHAFAPVLQLAAIVSARGDDRAAEPLIARARLLAPRDPVAREVERVIRAGRRVDLQALQQSLAGQAGNFVTR
ncbi:MAG: O-antigen ligase family protein [Solirubrobacteraceae bacterium]